MYDKKRVIEDNKFLIFLNLSSCVFLSINPITPTKLVLTLLHIQQGDLVEKIIDESHTLPTHTGIMSRTAFHVVVIRNNKDSVMIP